MPLKYMKYFECIGSGKGKISGLCTKSYSSQEVEAMQLLDIKLAEVTYAQKKQRVEDQSDPPLDPGTSIQAAPASQRSGTSQQPRTPASALARTHTSLPAQRQLTLPSMAIAERHNKANLQLGMLFYGCDIPFNVSRSPLFKRALQSVAEAGPGFKPVSAARWLR